MRAESISRRLTWPVIALGVGLIVTSAPAASKRVEATPGITLTEQSRGAVTTKVGTPVEIRLQTQAGTGFTWVPKLWAVFVTPMPPLHGKHAMPGGTQIQRFRFLAKQAGTYPVSFSYDQPWHGGTKGARTVSFLIVVR